MLLSVPERLVLLEALAQTQGSLLELKILRELKEELSFNEEEHGEFELRQEGETLRWNPQKAKDKDVEIGDVAREIIVRRLKELDRQKVLTERHLFICEKFPEVEEE